MKGLDPMPKETTTNGSFDDLLDIAPTVVEKEALADLQVDTPPAETAEQARIRALEAQLEAQSAQFQAFLDAQTAAQAVVPAEKTDMEKNQEHRNAVAANAAALNAREQFEELQSDEDYIVFHILESGFTFADRVWWVGQTVKLARGGKAYKDTVDREGNSWLDDLSSAAQYKRFKKLVVAEGPYLGPAFNDEISKLDAARGDSAPIITVR